MTAPKKDYSSYAKEWAARQRSGKNIHHRFLEKPAMYSLIPPVAGMNVLCIGCGTGEECRYIKDMGAATVVGIDNAEGMIAIARESWPDITWRVGDMNDLHLPNCTFDFVYSSLVFHYAPVWSHILSRIRASMRPGATMLLSTTNPIWEAMDLTSDAGGTYHYELSCDLKGMDTSMVTGDYLTERTCDRTYFDELNVSFYQRPISAMVNDIIASGLAIDGMWEPAPILEAKAKKKNFWAVHQKIPWLLIFRLKA